MVNPKSKDPILTIKSDVLFRLARSLSLSSRGKFGIHIKNMADLSFYELTGQSAYVWLHINGRRTIEEIIQKSRKAGRIKDSRFKTRATQFLKSLIEIGLVQTQGRCSKEANPDNLKYFLSLLKKRESQKGPRNPRKLIPRPYAEPGDRRLFLNVRRRFLKNLKGKVSIRLKREWSQYKGQVHDFSAHVTTVSDTERLVSRGRGFNTNAEAAACAAVGEALEGLCLNGVHIDYLSKSYNELITSGHRALDPKTYKFFHSNQKIFKNNEVSHPTRASRIQWTYFEDQVSSTKRILIPSEINGQFSRGKERAYFGDVTSSGCAFATDKETAKLKAALELVERDGALFYWRTQNKPIQIDLTTLPKRINALLDIPGESKKNIKLYFLKSELSFVTIQSVFFGNPALNEPRFVSNYATCINPVEAAEKSLLELLYVCGSFKRGVSQNLYGIDFDQSVWDFSDRTDLYFYQPAQEAYKFLTARNSSAISLDKIPNLDRGSARKNLEFLSEEFKKNSLRLFFADNTLPTLKKAGFWAYRAFSPDLISLEGVHRHRRLGYSRYYTLPKLLRLKRRPTRPSQLNVWPHPLP